MEKKGHMIVDRGPGWMVEIPDRAVSWERRPRLDKSAFKLNV